MEGNRDSGNVCSWNPKCKKYLLVKSRIPLFGIQNPDLGIRNPKDIPFGIQHPLRWNLVPWSEVFIMESGIQYCYGLPLAWAIIMLQLKA